MKKARLDEAISTIKRKSTLCEIHGQPAKRVLADSKAACVIPTSKKRLVFSLYLLDYSLCHVFCVMFCFFTLLSREYFFCVLVSPFLMGLVVVVFVFSLLYFVFYCERSVVLVNFCTLFNFFILA